MPTHEQIEAAARAIYMADDPWSAAFPWPNVAKNGSSVKEYRRIARAALTAAASVVYRGHLAWTADDKNVYLHTPKPPPKPTTKSASKADALLKAGDALREHFPARSRELLRLCRDYREKAKRRHDEAIRAGVKEGEG